MAQINLPAALPSVPGFSEQQVHGLINIIHSVIQQYLASPNQPPQQQPSSTSPAPQKAQKEENKQLQKQEQQPLQQATVKDIMKSTTESTTKSTISAIPRLCTVRSSGDSAACLSNLACQHINTLLDYTLLGYIKHSKGLKATGQG